MYADCRTTCTDILTCDLVSTLSLRSYFFRINLQSTNFLCSLTNLVRGFRCLRASSQILVTMELQGTGECLSTDNTHFNFS